MRFFGRKKKTPQQQAAELQGLRATRISEEGKASLREAKERELSLTAKAKRKGVSTGGGGGFGKAMAGMQGFARKIDKPGGVGGGFNFGSPPRKKKKSGGMFDF